MIITIPLLIKLPEMIRRYKVFKDGKTINFTSNNEELLKKYMKKYLKMLATKYVKTFLLNLVLKMNMVHT